MIYLIIWLTPIFLTLLLVYLDMEKGQSLEDYVLYKFEDAVVFLAFLVLVPFVNIIMMLLLALATLYGKIKHLKK